MSRSVSARAVLALLVLSLRSVLLADPAPGSRLEFRHYAATKDASNPAWGPLLTDVMRHEAPNDHNPYANRITKAHETSHGIHSHLRWILRPKGGAVTEVLSSPRSVLSLTADGDAERLVRRRVADLPPGTIINAFYVFGDRAVVIAEPPILKRHAIPHIPVVLRASRFKHYLEGQQFWDDRPLYIWDEWNAYVNGAQVGLQLVALDKWDEPWQDAMMGPLEFSVYAVAIAKAAAQRAPEHFAQNLQLREFLAWNLRRSMAAFQVGRDLDAFRWEKQELYYQTLVEHADAAPIRDFLRGLYGEAWCQEVMGF